MLTICGGPLVPCAVPLVPCVLGSILTISSHWGLVLLMLYHDGSETQIVSLCIAWEGQGGWGGWGYRPPHSNPTTPQPTGVGLGHSEVWTPLGQRRMLTIGGKINGQGEEAGNRTCAGATGLGRRKRGPDLADPGPRPREPTATLSQSARHPRRTGTAMAPKGQVISIVQTLLPRRECRTARIHDCSPTRDPARGDACPGPHHTSHRSGTRPRAITSPGPQAHLHVHPRAWRGNDPDVGRIHGG